jgi:hypothetical protein
MKLHTYEKNAERTFAFRLHMKLKKTQSFSKSFLPAISVSPFLVLLEVEHSKFNKTKQAYAHKVFVVTELFMHKAIIMRRQSGKY